MMNPVSLIGIAVAILAVYVGLVQFLDQARPDPQAATPQCVAVAQQVAPRFKAYFEGSTWHTWGTEASKVAFRNCLLVKGFDVD